MIPFPLQMDRGGTAEQTFPFSAVKFGCNFTGTNGQTSATDFSSSARTITFNGNAQILTNNSAFSAGSSLYLDGAGDYLSMPDSADWAPAANQDFCWRVVLCPDGTFAANSDIISQATGTGAYPWRIYRQSGANGGLGCLMCNSAGTLIVNATGGSITNNVFSEVAVMRFGTTVVGEINGKRVWTATGVGAALFDAANTMKIGIYNPPGGAGFKGWIQAARYLCAYHEHPAGLTFAARNKLFETS